MPIAPNDIRDWTIYKITNPSGRVYIGKSSNFHQRLRQYKCIQLKEQNLITRSLVKYGFDNHNFEVIDTFNGTGLQCEGKEMFWIKTYMSNRCKFKEQNGMNMTDGGEGVLGVKRSDKYREEARQRMLGKPTTERQKQIASLTHKGNNWTLGRKQSEEEKKKRSARAMGRKDTEIARKNKHAALKKCNGIKVIVFDSVFNITEEFETIVDAAKYVNMHRDNVRRILNGELKRRPNIKNRRYTFKYK